MYTGDFAFKLTKCNPRLYVKTGAETAWIYYKTPEAWEAASLCGLNDTELLEVVNDLNRGYVDTMVSRIPKDFIPEATIYKIDYRDIPFKAKEHRILCRGVRDILKILLAKKYVTRSKVQRHFNISSINEYDWDHLNMETRIARILRDESTRL